VNAQFGLFLSSLSQFLLFFGAAVVLTLIFVVVYTRITRHNELDLIKQNSKAAALAFSGSLVGFALPLASIMIHTPTVVGMVLWGVVALIIQVLVYLLLRLPMPQLSERIDKGEIAAGIWLGACSIVGGILNAAAMTP
jgi:putative membrane protein